MPSLPGILRSAPRDALVVTMDRNVRDYARSMGRRAICVPDDCQPTELYDRWSELTSRAPSALVIGGTPALDELVEQCCRRVGANNATGASRSRRWVQHLVANLPRAAEVPMAQQLAGKLQGVPAFIVGSGPSLAKNAHLLEQARAFGIVIAVNSASKCCRPTCTITVEANDLRHKIAPGHSVRLFALSSPPEMLAYGDGPLMPVLVGEVSRPLERLLGVPVLATSASGSTTACSLAHLWGCDPIVLVGQDLAFTDGRVYAPETGLADRIDAQGRFDWSAASRAAPRPGNPLPDEWPIEHVTAWGGQGTVMSTPMFSASAAWLTSFARAREGRCINATEGGRHVEGWTDAPLSRSLLWRTWGFTGDLLTLAGPPWVTADQVAQWLDTQADAAFLEAYAMPDVIALMDRHRSRPPLRPAWREAREVRRVRGALEAIVGRCREELRAR